MKFIVEVEVEAETPTQAFSKVEGMLEKANQYNRIQCWPESEYKMGEIKALEA